MTAYLSGLIRAVTAAVNRLEEALMVVFLTGAVLLTVVQIIFRYGFGIGFSWSEELILVFTIWLTLIGAGYAMRQGMHLAVDAFVARMPPGLRSVVRGLVLILCVFFAATMAVLAFRFVLLVYTSGEVSVPLGIPQWIPYSGLPLGLLLLTARSVQALWQFVCGRLPAASGGVLDSAI
jgi:C4-dicarboxylate transporter DctQ subunit